MITVDTLRADHLGCYGNMDIRTPNADKLAEQGVRFTRAFAHNVVTLPSHVNILTGTLPIYHGVRDNTGFRLDDRVLVLSEMLKPQGYRTSAFIGAFPLDDRFGLNQGFDVYDDYYGDTSQVNEFTEIERPAEEVVSKALNWIRKNKENAWFCWLHLYDPHFPYAPPPEYGARYPGNPYAGEVAYTDDSLSPLLDYLKKSRLWENTLVVYTADHGESLGAHKEKTHGIFAYNETLHVPLVFHHPRSFPNPGTIDKPVGHIDIVPTILDVLGIKIPGQIQGISLMPMIKRPDKWADQDIYFESMTPNLTRNWAPLDGVVSGNYKYIRLPVEELYNIKDDFKEVRNEAGREAGVAKDLQKRLMQIIQKKTNQELTGHGRVLEDAETRRKLLSLGYISSSQEVQKAVKRTYTAADDPKHLIELDHLSDEATGDFLRGNPAEGIKKLRKVIEKRPDFTRAYQNLAFIFHETGDVKNAIATLEKAAQLNIAQPSQLATLGLYLQEAGEFQKALSILEPLAAKFPFEVEALNNLGITYWKSGRHNDAEKAFVALLELDPGYASGYNNLGSVYLSLDEPDKAMEQFRKALQYDPNLATPYNGMGVIFAQRGDTARAIESWEKAVQLSDEQYDALFNLIIVLLREKKVAKAMPYMERFVRTAPEDRYGLDIQRIKQLLDQLRSP